LLKIKEIITNSNTGAEILISCQELFDDIHQIYKESNLMEFRKHIIFFFTVFNSASHKEQAEILQNSEWMKIADFIARLHTDAELKLLKSFIQIVKDFQSHNSTLLPFFIKLVVNTQFTSLLFTLTVTYEFLPDIQNEFLEVHLKPVLCTIAYYFDQKKITSNVCTCFKISFRS
jgi:hypothetical protein